MRSSTRLQRSKAAAPIAAMLLLAACAKPAPDPVLPAPSAIVKPGTTLSANPDPIVPEDDGPLGETTIIWSTTAKRVQIRIGGPNGTVFSSERGSRGTAKTGVWVNNGMTFYLQDMDAPNPASADATLGSIAIVVQ